MTTVLGDITAAGEDADVHIDELGTVLESLSNNERVVEAKTAIFFQRLKSHGMFPKKFYPQSQPSTV